MDVRLSRRKFLKRALIGAPIAFGAAAAEAAFIEPEWLCVKHLKLTPHPRHRFAHFTDIHYRGDKTYLQRVVREINSHNPDFVCFTGDLVEEKEFFAPALEILRDIKAPLYGIPGNHDYWAGADFDEARKMFSAQGGQWLMDEQTSAKAGAVNIIGVTGGKQPNWSLRPDAPNILLSHYPAWSQRIQAAHFDFILSGHSHGGQVRLPFVGAALVPSGVGEFEVGLFQTPAGPMYVNPGIGYFFANIRFNCRPEITIFEI
jgi:uncharacterized protein